MPMNPYADRMTFGLLPEPERRAGSFITAGIVNLTILAVVLYVGLMAKHALQTHRFEQTELIFPTTPPPPPKIKVRPSAASNGHAVGAGTRMEFDWRSLAIGYRPTT